MKCFHLKQRNVTKTRWLWPALISIKAPYCEENQVAECEDEDIGCNAEQNEIEIYLRCVQTKGRHKKSF